MAGDLPGGQVAARRNSVISLEYLFYSSRQEYSFNVISINLLRFIAFSSSATLPPKPSFKFNARGQFSIIYLLWTELLLDLQEQE